MNQLIIKSYAGEIVIDARFCLDKDLLKILLYLLSSCVRLNRTLNFELTLLKERDGFDFDNSQRTMIWFIDNLFRRRIKRNLKIPKK